jgi:methylmalonyl-CoA decarboxylase subunit alpha
MNNPVVEKWRIIKNDALFGNEKEKIARQEKNGKQTARKRIELLIDKESFEETDQLVTSQFLSKKIYTDGVVTGFGKINGRTVALYAQDFTLKGGSLGQQHAKKICKIMDMAAKIGCPIIGIIDSGGARIDEGIHALGGYGDIFLRNTRYSGIVPQISLVLGPCAGGATYSPALTDFIFTTEKISQLFITGPNVIKQVTLEEVTKEELGGAQIHAEKSGLVHFVSQTEQQCFEKVKTLISFLPQNYLSNTSQNSDIAFEEQEVNVSDIVPDNSNQAYNIKDVIKNLADTNSFFEIQKEFAKNIVVGFARFKNKVVGVVANQPLNLAGALDIDASCKAARFINFCNSFGIPIVSFVDVPGFLPGVAQEHNGIIRHGAKLISAYAQATVPKITIILRKAYGGAYIVMGSKHLAADFNFSWPTAQIAVLGAQAAINILHGKQLAKMDEEEKKITYDTLEKEYIEEFLNPFTAAEHGYIDAIIEPNDTRKHIVKALEITEEKVEVLQKRKVGNCPL